MPDEDLDLNDVISQVTAEATAEVEGEPLEAPEVKEVVEEKPDDKPDSTERGPDGKFAKKSEPAVEEEVKPEAEAKVETPGEETVEKVEEAPEEDDPLVANLSAEQISKIEENPELNQAYKLMQRGLTKARQADSAKVKDLSEKANMADWIKDNPQLAYDILAKRLGKNDPKAEDPIAAKAEETAVDATVDEVVASWAQKLNPEAAKLLAPLVKQTAETIARQIVAQQIEPLKASVTKSEETAREEAFGAQVSRFGAETQERGEEWNDDIITEMTGLMDRLRPGKDVEPQEYLGDLYDRVMMKRTRTASKQTALKRLRKAKESAEPTTSVRPAKDTPVLITDEMSEREAIAAAVAQATKETQAG